MSEQKYDSILVGWVDEPNFNDQGELMNWRVKLKDHVYLTLFMSKGGRACCRVYDPNSEGAKQARSTKKEAANVADDLPF